MYNYIINVSVSFYERLNSIIEDFMNIDELKKVKWKDIIKVGSDFENTRYKELGLNIIVPNEDEYFYSMDEQISDNMILEISDFKSIEEFYKYFKKATLHDALIQLYTFYQNLLYHLYFGWSEDDCYE